MGQRLLTCSFDQRGDDVCLTLAGELDLTVASQLEAVLAEALVRHPRILTVDAGGVVFIDTHSVGLLVQTYVSARAAGCHFSVVDSRGLVLRILSTMGLLDLLVPSPTIAAGNDNP